MNELVKQKLAEGWTLVEKGEPFRKGDLSFCDGVECSLDSFAVAEETCDGLYGYAVRPPAEKPADQPSELTFGQAMDAVAGGKKVEYISKWTSGWIEWDEEIDCVPLKCIYRDSYKFRLKPALEQPKFRPWKSVDEVPIGKIAKNKANNFTAIIDGAFDDAAGILVLWGGKSFYAREMLDERIMQDGSPCGVKE